MPINSATMTITPDDAIAYLEMNHGNRPLNTKHISFLAEQMKAGDWKLNGEAIKISKSNRLMDGQHRLSAIVEASKKVKTVVITGLDDDIFDTLDTGRLRSHADVFSLMGESYASALTALLGLLHRYYDNGWATRKARVSNVAMEALLERYPDARDFAGLSPRATGILTPRCVEFCHYVFSRINKVEADDFIKKLCTGNDLSAKSPISAVRNKLMDEALRGAKFKPDAQIVLIFKAWNAIRSGITLARPRYTQGEKVAIAK